MVDMHNMILYLLHVLYKHQLSKERQGFGSKFCPIHLWALSICLGQINQSKESCYYSAHNGHW